MFLLNREEMNDVQGYEAMTMAYEFQMSNREMGISGWSDEFLFSN